MALRMHHPCVISRPYAPYEKSIKSGNYFDKSFCFRRQNLHTESMQGEVRDPCLSQIAFVYAKLGTFREKKYR